MGHPWGRELSCGAPAPGRSWAVVVLVPNHSPSNSGNAPPPHPVTATVAPGGFPGPPALLASHCSCSVLQPKGLTPRAPLPPTGSRGASQLCPLSPTRALTCSHAHIPAATLPCWHPWHAAVPSPSHAQEHVHPHALGLSHTLTHPHTPSHTHTHPRGCAGHGSARKVAGRGDQRGLPWWVQPPGV